VELCLRSLDTLARRVSIAIFLGTLLKLGREKASLVALAKADNNGYLPSL